MNNPHLTLLQKAEELLRPLSRRVVFLGGASVSLHLDDRAARVRPTRDVDVLVEATTYSEAAEVEQELGKHGFTQNPIADEPICRWHNDGLVLDLMPTDPTVLGSGAKSVVPSRIRSGWKLRTP